MILPIIRYGHPVLRQKGAEIKEMTGAIRRLAQDMLETMQAARGVGLAAQQIGRALQLTVIDVRGTDRPSQMFVGVTEMAVEPMMPIVLINPRITRREGEEKGSEGCLSFPGISLEVARAGTIHVAAMGLDGAPLQFIATGLLSRAIQHELDHLNGVLFIDRVRPEQRKLLEAELRKLEKETRAALRKKRG
ncbi:MAG: peptide deformylase [Verrucomicrobia bacterium]|nr:peptide deformylase [Verrucomicrobiota bacterium]